MKNLLIYISSTGSFNNPSIFLANDADKCVKVQIENSLTLGWKTGDIMLVTNFDFEYGDVKATVLSDVPQFEPNPRANKINAIVKMFEKGLIENGKLYWFHDLDAFQLIPITETELKLGVYDIALTDYKTPSIWNTASLFFKKTSEDIFYKIKETMYLNQTDEERALNIITKKDTYIRKRIKKINRTYNFAPYSHKPCYKDMKIRPIKIAHFHPSWGPSTFKEATGSNTPLIPDRLMKIFNNHGIK